MIEKNIEALVKINYHDFCGYYIGDLLWNRKIMNLILPNLKDTNIPAIAQRRLLIGILRDCIKQDSSKGFANVLNYISIEECYQLLENLQNVYCGLSGKQDYSYGVLSDKVCLTNSAFYKDSSEDRNKYALAIANLPIIIIENHLIDFEKKVKFLKAFASLMVPVDILRFQGEQTRNVLLSSDFEKFYSFLKDKEYMKQDIIKMCEIKDKSEIEHMIEQRLNIYESDIVDYVIYLTKQKEKQKIK